MKKLYLLLCLVLLACTGDDAKYKAITGFEADKYLGTWYEIARLDHSFERGLDKVYAEYSFREDGGLKVVNHGFDTKKQKWHEAIGQAAHYAAKTGKAPVAAIMMPSDLWPPSEATKSKLLLIDETCTKLGIKLVLLRRSDN